MVAVSRRLPAVAVAFSMAAAGGASAQEADVEKRIDALLAKMSVEEKVGQLHQLSRMADPTGPAPGRQEASPSEQARQGALGSMLNIVDPREAAALQKEARASRAGIPLIFGYDVIHGYRTIFPVPLAEASSWDPALAERFYAEELANYLADNVQAWRLQADGAYSRITPEDGAMPHSAQDSLLAQLCH